MSARPVSICETEIQIFGVYAARARRVRPRVRAVGQLSCAGVQDWGAVVVLDRWCQKCWVSPLRVRVSANTTIRPWGRMSPVVVEEVISVMAALLPLAYGYVRDDLIDDKDRGAGDDALRAAARSLGYELATVFHEPPPREALLPPAFVDLVRECRRSAAHMVITLPGHLSNMSMSRMILQEVLQVRADAVVHEIEG